MDPSDLSVPPPKVQDDEFVPPNPSYFEQRIRDASIPYRLLLDAKRCYRAATAEQFDAGLEKQGSPPDAFHDRFSANRRAIQTISRTHGDYLSQNQVRRFLDLGCAPGGFSRWLLHNNRNAEGAGITLHRTDGKFPFSLGMSSLTERYTLHYADIIPLATKSESPNSETETNLLESSPSLSAPFDLVIAGAIPPTLMLEPSIEHCWQGHRQRIQLLLSQVLIAFKTLEQGGSCIILTKNKPTRWLFELLPLLRDSFAEVSSCKGSHLVRSSCYIVCRGFRATGEHLQNTIVSLQAVLKDLDTGDADESSQNYDNIMLLSQSSDDELFANEHEYFLQLFEQEWKVQSEAMEMDIFACTYSHLSRRANKSCPDTVTVVVELEKARADRSAAILAQPQTPISPVNSRRRQRHSPSASQSDSPELPPSPKSYVPPRVRSGNTSSASDTSLNWRVRERTISPRVRDRNGFVANEAFNFGTGRRHGHATAPPPPEPSYPSASLAMSASW